MTELGKIMVIESDKTFTVLHSQKARYPVYKEGSILLDQEDCQPLEEVPDGLLLILSRGPGQLLDLKDCLRVPAPWHPKPSKSKSLNLVRK